MRRTAEHNRKISQALKGHQKSASHRRALGNSRRGYTWERECLSCGESFTTKGSRSWVCDSCRSVSIVVHCSHETYEKLLVVQGGVCGLCGELPKITRGRPLHVDHSHKTGQVRGLLCNYCNRTAIPVLERFAPEHPYLVNPPIQRIGTVDIPIPVPRKARAPERVTTVPGVTWHNGCAKWRAYGKEKGRQVHIGLFQKEQDAAEAATAWRKERQQPIPDKE